MNVALLALRGDFGKSEGGSGIRRYIYCLSSNMKRNPRRGLNITPREYTPAFTQVGTSIAFAFESLLDSFSGVDVIHNLMELPFAKPSALRRDATLVSTAHEFAPLTRPELDHGILDEVMSGFLNLSAIRIAAASMLQSDYLIANSTQTMAEAIRLGYSRKRISVVSLGLDNRFLRAPDREPRPVSRRKFIVGYIGTIRRRKGMKMLMDAIQYIDKSKYRFDIYGNSRIFQYEEFLNFARHDPVLSFKGFAPENSLVDVYDGFDAFVFPSMYEGFGLPIIEAKARGLPVIINKRGSIPREVRRYCFEADGPEEVADILDTLRKNGYDGRSRLIAMRDARKFRWSRTARETMAVYERIG